MVDINAASSAAKKETLLEHIKNFNADGIIKSLKSYPFDWVEIGSCAGIGLLSGFLFKKYFKTFVMTVLFAVIIIAVLDKLDLVAIDWNHLQSKVGIHSTQESFQNLFQATYAWAKVNIQAVTSFTFGFILGYKVG